MNAARVAQTVAHAAGALCSYCNQMTLTDWSSEREGQACTQPDNRTLAHNLAHNHTGTIAHLKSCPPIGCLGTN